MVARGDAPTHTELVYAAQSGKDGNDTEDATLNAMRRIVPAGDGSCVMHREA
jgi:hypothetical protein